MEEDNPPLEYIITHVFCPPRLPCADDHSTVNDHALIRAVVGAANAYTQVVDQPEWPPIAKMLENLAANVQSPRLDKKRVISQLNRMRTGGTRSIFDATRLVSADDVIHAQRSSRSSFARKTRGFC